MADWYTISNAQAIPSPTVLVYPDRIEANLQRMILMAGDAERLRPHVKTTQAAADHPDETGGGHPQVQGLNHSPKSR